MITEVSLIRLRALEVKPCDGTARLLTTQSRHVPYGSFCARDGRFR